MAIGFLWLNGLKKEENNFMSGAMRGENIFYYSNGVVRRKIFLIQMETE